MLQTQQRMSTLHLDIVRTLQDFNRTLSIDFVALHLKQPCRTVHGAVERLKAQGVVNVHEGNVSLAPVASAT